MNYEIDTADIDRDDSILGLQEEVIQVRRELVTSRGTRNREMEVELINRENELSDRDVTIAGLEDEIHDLNEDLKDTKDYIRDAVADLVTLTEVPVCDLEVVVEDIVKHLREALRG